METVKTRKQGNAIMITLASKFNISAGKEFFIYKKENGIIMLVPKIENPYINAKAGEYYTPEIDWNYTEAKGEEWN